MRGMCHICVRYDAKISIVQSHQVYSYLQRISTLLEMEVYRANKTIKNKELCLSYRAKDVAHFLSEGQICLNMVKILHEHNQKMSSMSAIMLRAMDIYSKLKMHLRGKEFDWSTDEEFSSGDEDNLYHWDVPSSAEEEISDFEEIYEIDFNQICFCCIGEVYYREFLLTNIESLIIRIKNLCVAFTGSSSTLYDMLYLTLRNYCKRVKLFLNKNTRPTDSQQESSLRDYDYHKHDFLKHLLKQLLERINKEQEYLARYTDLKLI